MNYGRVKFLTDAFLNKLELYPWNSLFFFKQKTRLELRDTCDKLCSY